MTWVIYSGVDFVFLSVIILAKFLFPKKLYFRKATFLGGWYK